MYKFITKFLNPKPPVPLAISFDSIPTWVEERRQKAQDSLAADTSRPEINIRNGMAQLQHIINSIAGAEHDPAIHPKLKSIAKNSLPLFVKAMNSSLSRDLPDDIEEFYTASVESVKGCINSTRGQGRYLQVVFPAEMKEVKTGIDAIGHEINSLTSSLGKYRRERDQLDVVIGLHDSLLALQTDITGISAKDQRIGARITEIQDRLIVIDQELEKLSSDERMREVRDLLAASETSGKNRDEAIRRYTTLTMTASHVFRKAEKIAMKQQHHGETTVLRQVLDILSDHSLPDCTDLTRAVSSASPLTLRMIDSGEISLKNKEERTVFSDTARFCEEIGNACRELKTEEEECAHAERALAVHPLLTRKNSLEREKTQLETMLVKENNSRKELAQWKEKNKEKIPLLVDELNRKIRDIFGEAVQIQINNIPGV